MASGDEESYIDHVLSPSDGEQQQEQNVRDPGIVSTDEGRLPRPSPDLEPSSPSFVRERSFTFGTPSGEVQFRRNTRYEHIGEPAHEPHVHYEQNQSYQTRNKDSDDLRAQIAAMQASLSVISSRLESQNMSHMPINDAYGPPPVRSASVPSHFPTRMQASQDRNTVVSDQYAIPIPVGRERSLSPQRCVSENYPNFGTASSAPVNVNYRNNRSHESYIKVAVYDGKTSWKDYLVQFELAAQANGWNKPTRAIRLACNLRGSAQALLSDLTPEIRQNYDQLVTTLTERFEPQNQCEIYKSQLKQRIRKRDEGLPELAQDIKRLTRMAYPSAFLDLRDTLSKDSFIEALNDAEMELFICQKEPATIDDAVRLALKYEAFTQGRRKRIASAKNGVRMQFEEQLPSLLSQSEIQEIRNDIRELKTCSNGPSQKSSQNNKRACYGCGQTDHLIRECPNRDNVGASSRHDKGYHGYKHDNRHGSQNNNESNTNTNGRNWYRNKNQGNSKKLAPRVRPQL